MKIRRATIEDTEIIAEYNYNLAWETEHKELNKEILSNGVSALIQDENKGVYHVCEIDGKVIGQIMYTFEWSDWRNGTFLWIQSVYVDKDYRGKGVFKSLYKYIKNMCDKDENYCGLRLYVEQENHVAMETYKSLGMYQCDYYIYEYEKKDNN